MGEIIHLSQPQAATMTTMNELIKLYSRKGSDKYAEAIDKNKKIYKNLMDEVLGRNEEASEEAVAA